MRRVGTFMLTPGESRRHLRNLHRRRQERRRSFVKDAMHYSRNWFLQANNNHELREVVGHEREATENFARYRHDDNEATWYLSTSKINDIPPLQRIPILEAQMERRWRVKGSSMDKLRDLIRSVECWEEAFTLGQISYFDSMPPEMKLTLSNYIDAIMHVSRNTSSNHHATISGLLRVADVCHTIRHPRQGDLLNMADSLVSQSEITEKSNAPIRLQSVKMPQSHPSEQGPKYFEKCEYRRPEGPPPPSLRHPFSNRLTRL